MNGYQMHIDAYRQVLESDRTDIDRDFIRAEIKALEPFAETYRGRTAKNV